jgi:hypothetical protein
VSDFTDFTDFTDSFLTLVGKHERITFHGQNANEIWDKDSRIA